MPSEQIVEFYAYGVSDQPVLKVATLEGAEAISIPYRFDLDLLSAEKSLKLENAVGGRAKITLKQRVPLRDGKPGTRSYDVFGVLASFEQLDLLGDRVKYRAVLVPRLWNLSLTEQTRIFQDMSVAEVVGEILEKDYALKEKNDFEFKFPKDKYPKREYVVQYKESDLAFVSRWLEHEGIFYFFEQKDDRDKIVFGDDTAVHPPIHADVKVPYRPVEGGKASGAEGGGEEVVRSLVCRQNRIPKEVILHDWNYRTPAVGLKATAEVYAQGVGKVYEYGNHFKTKEEGDKLAKVRAEAIRCRQKVLEGTGDCRLFRSGATFTLEKHYRSDFNGKYLLTQVRHEVTQPADTSSGGQAATRYVNSFTCIPDGVAFRPARVTPWPRIHGFTNAVIDSSGDDKVAELDEEGRYSVKIPFDLSGKKDGKASRKVRMAQPYAGPNYGMHFPLHKGTEVLLGHKDGDPDRPVILSAVPNPQNGTPVKNTNQTQAVIHTGGNNMIRLDDKDGAQKVFIHGEKDVHVRAKNDTVEWVGRNRHLTVKQDRIEKVENKSSDTVDKDRMDKVGGDLHVTVTGKGLVDVGGSYSLKVGGAAVEAFKADLAQDVTGAFHLKAQGVVIEAPAGITLKSGGNSVVIDGAGVTLKGTIVTIDGNLVQIAMGPGSPPKPGKGGSAMKPAAPAPPEEADTPAAAAAAGTPAQAVLAGSAIARAEPAKPHKEDPQKSHWVEIELVDQDRRPVPGERYRVKLPDGSVAEGSLDDQGRARIQGAEAGNCEISFPNLHKDDWEPA